MPTQLHRELSIATPLGKDVLLLVGFEGQEEISRLFHYQLEMISKNKEIEPRALLGRNVTFSVTRGGCTRHFNGFVSRFSGGGTLRQRRFRRYHAEVVPWTWFLTRTADCRIFQHRTVPQTVEQIFKDAGFQDFDFSFVRGRYPQRTYCVQYRETDFAFVSRLLEDEGIFYFFRHENGKHTLVLADNKQAYRWCRERNVRFQATETFHPHEDRITDWERRERLTSGKWAHTDYNFQTPRHDLMCGEAAVLGVPAARNLEIYDYPGSHEETAEGRRRVRVRMEEVETGYEAVEGGGTCTSFTPGARFTLRDHPAEDENGKTYVITSIRHFATEPASYQTHPETDDEERGYRNEFEAIPESVLFRPARTTPRSIVEGPQTAVITGPPGEEIYTDEHGRVKVQFHWDREGKRDENTSCWLRVSQAHSGQGWGNMDLPRVGEEVIVGFLEGDPDRPIVEGRVYNGEQVPPFALPGSKTRRGNSTKTYLGSGYNEMSMDDTPGAEQLRIHGQYNMDTVVENNQTLDVGVDRADDVGNNEQLEVAVDGTLEVGNDAAITVGNDATYVVGNNIVIKAGVAITLNTGASTIHMNQAGVISISGNFVTSAAAANNATVAPLVQISGSKMLLEAGLAVLDLAGLKHVKGGQTKVAGSTVKVKADGEVIIKGGPIKLGEVGAPMAGLPPVPKAGDGDSSLEVGSKGGRGITQAEADKAAQEAASQIKSKYGDYLKRDGPDKVQVLEHDQATKTCGQEVNGCEARNGDQDTLVLDESKGSSSTVYHEAVHSYCSDAFRLKTDKAIREGATEYFTRQLLPGVPRSSYPEEAKQIRLGIDSGAFTEEDLKKAYFSGDNEAIQKVKNGMGMGRF